MEYTVELTLGGMVHIPSFMTIGLGIQTMLSLFPE
jgi:hypothetical protein